MSPGLRSFNSVMINNLIVNIIENSYGKNKIILSEEYFKNPSNETDNQLNKAIEELIK